MRRIWVGLVAISLGLVTVAEARPESTREFLLKDENIAFMSKLLKVPNNKGQKSSIFTTVDQSATHLYQRLDLKFGFPNDHCRNGKCPDPAFVQVWVKVPKNPTRKLPLIFVLGGVDSSPDILDMFPDQTDAMIAVFDFGAQKYEKLSDKIRHIASQMLYLQPRIAVTLNHLSSNPQVDPAKINVVMVSFGSFVGPLALRYAYTIMDSQINSTVFAFGGGSLSGMAIPKMKQLLSDADYKNVMEEIKSVAQYLEPEPHLRKLTGKFLVVTGDADKLIPAESTQVLFNSLREPKQEIKLPVGHINRGHNEIVKATVLEVEKWMKDNGAL